MKNTNDLRKKLRKLEHSYSELLRKYESLKVERAAMLEVPPNTRQGTKEHREDYVVDGQMARAKYRVLCTSETGEYRSRDMFDNEELKEVLKNEHGIIAQIGDPR